MANNKSKGSGRACSVCNKSGHNSRTCSLKKEQEARAQAAGGGVPSANASTALIPHPETTGVQESPMPLRPQMAPQIDIGARHEPVSFAEQAIQRHVNGNTYKLTLREYPNGASNVTLRKMNDASPPTEIVTDIEGAQEINQMFAIMLQRVAAAKAQRTLPVSRVNGLSQPQGQQAAEAR